MKYLALLTIFPILLWGHMLIEDIKDFDNITGFLIISIIWSLFNVNN